LKSSKNGPHVPTATPLLFWAVKQHSSPQVLDAPIAYDKDLIQKLQVQWLVQVHAPLGTADVLLLESRISAKTFATNCSQSLMPPKLLSSKQHWAFTWQS
jgi:hypothetical protein